MVTVEIIKSGKILRVTPNEAHGMIERGVARLYNKVYKTKPMMPTSADESEGLRSRGRISKHGGYRVK